jgi:hypothetical protein
MQTRFNLKEALNYIEFQSGKSIVKIQHQDASGRKFLVRFMGESFYQSRTL